MKVTDPCMNPHLFGDVIDHVHSVITFVDHIKIQSINSRTTSKYSVM